MLTLAQFKTALPFAGARLSIFVDPLNSAMQEFGITQPIDQATFLAQIAHESMNLRYTAEVWGPTPAQTGYEGRADLGNTQPGDGRRFKGRGLIQITGRTNTEACLRALGRPVDDFPYLELPVGACRSAGWYWRSRNLSDYTGRFWTTSKIVNGGTNGLDDRIEHYVRCRRALNV